MNINFTKVSRVIFQISLILILSGLVVKSRSSSMNLQMIVEELDACGSWADWRLDFVCRRRERSKNMSVKISKSYPVTFAEKKTLNIQRIILNHDWCIRDWCKFSELIKRKEINIFFSGKKNINHNKWTFADEKRENKTESIND